MRKPKSSMSAARLVLCAAVGYAIIATSGATAALAALQSSVRVALVPSAATEQAGTLQTEGTVAGVSLRIRSKTSRSVTCLLKTSTRPA